MRVTTNSMVRSYNNSLSSTLNSLNVSRSRLETRRKFTKAYEDPAAASKAASLTKKYLDIEDNISTVENAMGRQDSADSAIQQIVSMVSKAAKDEGLKAVTDSTSTDAKKTYATSLRQMQESLLQMANSKYSDSYLFAGADGDNAPFALDDSGEVTFRGIPVSSTNQADIDSLKKMADEKIYIDVGLGLQYNTNIGTPGNPDNAQSYNDINGATAFDIAFSGLSLFGFGTSGNPPLSNNAIELVGQMADELEASSFDKDKFNQLTDQLMKCHSSMADYNSKVGVKKQFLETTHERLKTDKLNIYTQLDSVANIEPTQAIMDYSYSQYAYNMVLKVGSSLLTNSFIDFMK